MRIGIDASCLPARMAGAGRYITGLLAGLNAVDQNNEYVVFIKQRDLPRFECLGDNFKLEVLPDLTRPGRIWWQFNEPQHLAARHKLDVWHATHYTLPRNMSNVRTVVTFHDMAFLLFPELYSLGKSLFFHRTIRDAVARADSIVSVSQATANDIRRLFRDRVRRLLTVHSGPGFNFNADTHGNNESTMTQDRPYILFVGTLEKRKNLVTLIEAFARLVSCNSASPRLVLVGQSGNACRDIKRKISDCGLEDMVSISGYVAEQQLRLLYTNAEIFVYPSLYEGFGFPVLEAMSCGTPALASANSALAEIAGESALTAHHDDPAGWFTAMQRILQDPTFRNQMISAGLKNVARFSWQKTAEQMLAAYAETNSKSIPVNGRHLVRGNGYHNGSVLKVATPPALSRLSRLNRAVLQTLAYSDLFDYPLRPWEIHEGLIGKRASAEEVKASLDDADLTKFIDRQQEFYYIKGKAEAVQKRQRREGTSRELIARNQFLLKLVCHFPFVEAVALSGSLAFENSEAEDDIDLFIILDSRRTWTAYFLLVTILKMLGKRNLICLNYLYAKRELTISDQDFFVAHQIANLRPIAGCEIFEAFFASNMWIHKYLPQAMTETSRNGKSRFGGLAKSLQSKPGMLFKKILERALNLRLFNGIEKVIYARYSTHIRRITSHLNGSVQVEPDIIRLFTHDHRHKTLQRLNKRFEEIAVARSSN